MNYFRYITDQVTPFAESIQPTLFAVFMSAFAVYIMIVMYRFGRGKKRDAESIDWTRVPLSVMMLIYTFEHTFIPDNRTALSWVIVFAAIVIALSWLKEPSRDTAPEDKEKTEEGSSN